MNSRNGYLNDSAGADRPAVVIVHEWWGLNAHIRSVADRFAREGYVAHAVDLYGGALPKNVAEAQQLVANGDKALWMTQLTRAVSELRPRTVSLIGFSMGGAFALATAARMPDLRACVSFYGAPRPEVDLKTTRAKVLGHYARNDTWVPDERLAQLQAERPGVTLHRYDAQHSFFDEQRPDVYAPEAAKLAWERTLAFLAN